MNTTISSILQIQEAQRRTIRPEERPTAAPPLPPDRFGLAVGRIMERFGIRELPVVAPAGNEIGTLMLSTGSYRGVSMTAVAWEHIEEREIQQDIAEAEAHDQTASGVCGTWDTAGLARLDQYRSEIMVSLIAAVAAARDENTNRSRKYMGVPEKVV